MITSVSIDRKNKMKKKNKKKIQIKKYIKNGACAFSGSLTVIETVVLAVR